MKIAIIGISLFSQGAEFVQAAVARGLSSRGHEVDVIVTGVHEDIAREHPELRPFKIGDSSRLVILKARRGRQCVGELRRLYRKGRYDVVMCHALPLAIPARLAGVGLWRRPRFVYVEHLGGIGTNWRGDPVPNKFSLVKSIKQSLMRLYDAQFAVSRGTLEAIHRVSGYPMSRLHLVYNPVLDETFEMKQAMAPLHPWLRNPERPVVVAAGAFNGVKNYELLIEAFALVRKQCDCRLVIFGDGVARSKYEALIAEHGLREVVSLPGYTNQLPAELKGAACFVVSSTVESFSIVLVEALSAGVPVVSTDAPYGPREVLQGGKYGIIVPNKDREALATAIVRVLEGHGIEPRKEMVERFTVKAATEVYERELGSVLKGEQ